MRVQFLFLLVFPSFSYAAVDYTRDIRPILSQHCFQCHGPDETSRKGKLRLDIRDSAIGKGESGDIAIIPGKSANSELFKRLHSADATELMPPPATKKPLSDTQKKLLATWIDEGAVYQEHWAFLPPKAQPGMSIDQFIKAKLTANGLTQNGPASKETLLRRVYLDLIGLPPSPTEAAEFLNDQSPEAYEKLVDRLLKSPHYGERWARKWLDLARYADTNGFEKDRPRTMWPYRDWVINAINANMPFDQFTIEQLAGDLLPNATQDQKIATGFHRNTMTNEEGGIDPLEFRWHSINDRVATTGTTWLGLTLNCCQCHNHKFDPISQAEYFKIFAFLNNADEPTLNLDSATLQTQRENAAKQLAEARRQSLDRIDATKFKTWLDAERAKAIAWTIAIPTEATANIPTLNQEADGVIFVSGDLSKRDIYTLKYARFPKGTTAIRIEIFADPRLPNNGPGRVSYEGPFGDFFLTELTLKANGNSIPFGFASATAHDGRSKPEHAVDGQVLTGWSINGKQGQNHQAVFNLKQPLEADMSVELDMLFEKYYAAGLGKFRISYTNAAIPVEAKNTPHAVESLLYVDAAKFSKEQEQQLREYYIATSPDFKAYQDTVTKIEKSISKPTTALVLQERPAGQTRPTPIYKRGEYSQPLKTTVQPGVPSVLPGLPKDAAANRLTFARWLVSSANPLTARVVVNRQWAAFFGKGIVKTLEDFGYQGDAPTHPELLDWLAIEFMNNQWDMKKLHRLIVLSATYRQSSEVKPVHTTVDPKNTLLAHFPRQRLEAEVLRDQALTISGKLSKKLGGPSVFPPQPPGVTSEGTYGQLAWRVSTGEDRYRRGLYTYVKRTAPYAMFQTFDGPSGEACTAKREVSNTPLQALTMLNDAVYQELAQALAEELLTKPTEVDSLLATLWKRCLLRAPTAEELATLKGFYNNQVARFDKFPTEATAIAGQTKHPPKMKAPLVATIRVLFNLDELVTKE